MKLLFFISLIVFISGFIRFVYLIVYDMFYRKSYIIGKISVLNKHELTVTVSEFKAGKMKEFKLFSDRLPNNSNSSWHCYDPSFKMDAKLFEELLIKSNNLK